MVGESVLDDIHLTLAAVRGIGLSTGVHFDPMIPLHVFVLDLSTTATKLTTA